MQGVEESAPTGEATLTLSADSSSGEDTSAQLRELKERAESSEDKVARLQAQLDAIAARDLALSSQNTKSEEEKRQLADKLKQSQVERHDLVKAMQEYQAMVSRSAMSC